MFRPIDPQQSFPALELEVLERWRDRDVFAESVRRRAGADQWVFYEGPPTANGPPGSHHVLARVFKDIYPRYKTMCGYRAERKGGWDCHGLAVEIAVEQQLGLTNKAQIEEFGIAEFNARCRESVFEFLEQWNRLTERIGFWVDLDTAYRTLDPTYIESVWWALEAIHAKGLLYEAHRVVPYCPRCGTALSSHEVSQGYRDVTDASAYVKLWLAGEPKEALLVWTTTPWTLPGNRAAAVAPEVTYARVRAGAETLIVAEALVERVFGPGADVLATMPGSELVGRHYQGPIFALTDQEPGAFPVLGGDFVTTEDGTGIVHVAPAFGEDDFRVAAAQHLFDPTNPPSLYNPVTAGGTYDERVVGYAGRSVVDPQLAAELLDELRERGLLFKEEMHEHSYPHCWRCGTRLLYYAKPSWYIATSRLRDRLLAANETVNWYPPRIKSGRFGDWLAGNVDWALSRERYWGTPLPIWRCSTSPDHPVVCIGSFAELERRSGTAVEDPHRPYVDALGFPCEECGSQMRRVPEVIDVWFDSGSMPFAQHHAPFENEERYAQAFPADFVCEALDQTRGWFYSLIAVSTLLNDRAPYRNVVCLGLLVDGEGQKMSKSKGNVISPWEVIDRFGADAFRWYFFTSKQPWDDRRFSVEAVGEGVRLFLRQLWNVYAFFVLYANAGGEHEGASNDLDRWALSRLAATVEVVRERLDAYDATSAGREIAAYLEDLSNWYVRRSRRRFWDGDGAALATLRTVLITLAKLLAPFTPFVADELYDNLDGELASVHLCEFPAAGERDLALEFAMATARETVRLGLAARRQGAVKVRQPLRAAIVVADGREREAIERLAEIVREELNVTALRFVAAADELGTYIVKANFRTLGPRFAKRMPQLAAAVAALDPSAVSRSLREGRTIVVSVAGSDHELTADDLNLALAPLPGYGLERDGAHAVALELTLDEELIAAGHAREIVHAVQACRKDAGLEISDRIELWLGGDEGLLDGGRAHEAYIARETLARSVGYGERDDWLAAVEVDGRTLKIGLRRA